MLGAFLPLMRPLAPSDEIGTTGSDHSVMLHPPQHTVVLLFVNKDFSNSTLKVLRIIWALLEEDRDGVN